MVGIAEADYQKRFVGTGYTQDIMDALLAFIQRRKGADTLQYARLLRYQSTDVQKIFRKVWIDFKTSIQYEKDPKGEQNLKSAARLWADKRADCKSFTNAIADVCYNLCNLITGITIRFTKYEEGEFSHVYLLVHTKKAGDIIMDCVWTEYNSEKKYLDHQDYHIDMTKIFEVTGFKNQMDTYIQGVTGDIQGISGTDYSSVVDLGSVTPPAWIAGKGKEAVKKFVGGALKPVINYVMALLATHVGPFFLYQWVATPPSEEVSKRKAAQLSFLNMLSNKLGIKRNAIMETLAKGIQKKFGMSPQEVVKRAQESKVSGTDEIGVLPAILLAPSVMNLALGAIRSISAKIVSLLGGNIIDLTMNHASDLALLAGKNYAFDKSKNHNANGRFNAEEWALLDRNKDKLIDKLFDPDGNGKVNGQWLKANGRLDIPKIKAEIEKYNKAEIDRRNQQSETDKKRNVEVEKKRRDAEAEKKRLEMEESKKKETKVDTVTDGGGSGSGGGGNVVQTGGEGEKKNNTMLYVVGGVLTIGAIGTIIYFGTRKQK